MSKINKFLFPGLLLINTTVLSAPWQNDILAYDINGNPYTGKAYINEMAMAEEDIENGIPVRILTDACMRGNCERKEIINGIPYIRSQERDGKPLDGQIKTEPQKQENNWTQTGLEGTYVNGIPDGLHKEYNDKGLIQETMYDKGKTLWIKRQQGNIMPPSPYLLLETDMFETVYENNLITDKYYKNQKEVLEIKKLPSGQLVRITLYEDGKILMRQRFRKNGTSLVENFIDGTKKDLPKNQIYYLTKMFNGWEEGQPYDYKPYQGFFYVISGNRAVCLGIIDSPEGTRCLKDIHMPALNIEQLSPEQQQLFYENPKEFFAQNEAKLDLSDVGELNIKELNADIEERVNQLMSAMQSGLQGMVEGMAEGLNAQSEEEFKDTVQKHIEDSISNTLQ